MKKTCFGILVLVLALSSCKSMGVGAVSNLAGSRWENKTEIIITSYVFASGDAGTYIGINGNEKFSYKYDRLEKRGTVIIGESGKEIDFFVSDEKQTLSINGMPFERVG